MRPKISLKTSSWNNYCDLHKNINKQLTVRERESVKKVEFITMWEAFQVIVKILYLLISVCVFVCVFVGGCLKIGIMCVCVCLLLWQLQTKLLYPHSWLAIPFWEFTNPIQKIWQKNRHKALRGSPHSLFCISIEN